MIVRISGGKDNKKSKYGGVFFVTFLRYETF